MMSKGIILSVDKNSGIKKIFHKDKITGEITIESVQDLSESIKNSKAELEANDNNWNKDLFKVAQIPKTIFDAWRKEIGSDPAAPENAAWLMNRLNSPEFIHFRTKAGKI
jgi:hypothetical protein